MKFYFRGSYLNVYDDDGVVGELKDFSGDHLCGDIVLQLTGDEDMVDGILFAKVCNLSIYLISISFSFNFANLIQINRR